MIRNIEKVVPMLTGRR